MINIQNDEKKNKLRLYQDIMKELNLGEKSSGRNERVLSSKFLSNVLLQNFKKDFSTLKLDEENLIVLKIKEDFEGYVAKTKQKQERSAKS